VVAVEIDPRKVELAAHNARIYGVDDMIEFVVADFFHLAPSLKVCSSLYSMILKKKQKKMKRQCFAFRFNS
jgi:23S rRNA G2445 N2-methylase RlmL